MPHEDNEIWLDALAGKIRAPSSMEREIAVIRHYYQSSGEIDCATDPAAQQLRQARMCQWLQERGAFGQAEATAATPEKASPVPARLAGRLASNRAWYVMAAAVLIAAFTLVMLGELPEKTDPNAYTMRGAAAIQVRDVSNPAALATQVEQALAQFGVPVRRLEEEGGSVRLETRIADQDIPAARKLLESYQLTVPDNGIFIARFRRQS